MTEVRKARHVALRPVRVDRVGEWSAAATVTAAWGVGAAAGVANVWAENLVDSPVWMSAFHTLTPWVLVTLAVGFALRGRLGVAWLAGLVTQLGLVAGFYLAEPAFSARPLDVRSWVAYSLFALVTGPLFGFTGALLDAASSLSRTWGLGAATGAVLADGVREIVAVLNVGTHVLPGVLVGASYIAAGIGLAVVVARTRRDLLAILLGGAAFCGLVILGLDVLLV